MAGVRKGLILTWISGVVRLLNRLIGLGDRLVLLLGRLLARVDGLVRLLDRLVGFGSDLVWIDRLAGFAGLVWCVRAEIVGNLGWTWNLRVYEVRFPGGRLRLG